MINASRGLTQSFTFDAEETFSNGAYNTGTFKVGIQLPNNALVFTFAGICNVPFVSPGPSQFDIGVQGNLALFGTSLIPIFPGLFVISNFVTMNNTLNVLIRVSTNPVTAGKFTGYFIFFPQT